MNKLLAFGKTIWSGVEWVSNQMGWVAGALTGVMMIAVVREVGGRYFFNKPSDWTDELSCYLLVGCSYLALAHTELMEGHVRVDFVYSHFRGKVKKLADIMIPIIGLCWSAIVVWQGGKIAWQSLVNNAHSSEAMMWPLFPSQVTVPIGAFLLCLILINKILKNFRPSDKKIME